MKSVAVRSRTGAFASAMTVTSAILVWPSTPRAEAAGSGRKRASPVTTSMPAHSTRCLMGPPRPRETGLGFGLLAARREVYSGCRPRMLLKTVCLSLLFGAVLTAAPQPPAAIADLLADYAEWIQGRRATLELTAPDLDVARQSLARLDPAAIAVDPSLSAVEARERQRRLTASFALELAALGSRKHAAAAARLVEWACPYVRSHTPVNDFDRAWQLAALAALEGGIDSTTLQAHLDHIQAAFG